MEVKYSEHRYKGLNYVEKELAKKIDDLSKLAKNKLNISIIYFNNTKKTGVSRMGYFPHLSNGTKTISSWDKISGKKMVIIKKMLEGGDFYGLRKIGETNCKVRLKNKLKV